MHFVLHKMLGIEKQSILWPRILKKILKDWCAALESKYKESEDNQIWNYMLDHRINTDIATISYMKEWIRCLIEMKQNKRIYKRDNIK